MSSFSEQFAKDLARAEENILTDIPKKVQDELNKRYGPQTPAPQVAVPSAQNSVIMYAVIGVAALGVAYLIFRKGN